MHYFLINKFILLFYKMEDKNAYKKINYNFELLRLILCLWVVFHHCCRNVDKIKGNFHVPTFMIMSFYFYYNTLKTKNIARIKHRFQRILIPYIIWPIFILFFNNILFKFYGLSPYKKKLLLKDLVLQLIFGGHYHFVFYYQFNLIFLTLVFNIFSFLFNKKFIFIFQILLIVAYIFQYSYLNVFIFTKYINAIRFPLGTISELLPFAVTGVNLCYLDIAQKLKKFKKLVIFFIGVIIFLIIEFDIFVEIRGFIYTGIFFNIGGIFIFILFSLFSLPNRKLIISPLKIITKFTGGIYYIHMLFYNSLIQKFLFIQKRTIYSSIVIYIIS